jgi:thiamine pyrophosphate-dependent acetolactate synthase large subunit-like protein
LTFTEIPCAAGMAGAAKFTGELRVCIATSGPGATHLVTGLYDALLDHMPVLAITGRRADGGPDRDAGYDIDSPHFACRAGYNRRRRRASYSPEDAAGPSL